MNPNGANEEYSMMKNGRKRYGQPTSYLNIPKMGRSNSVFSMKKLYTLMRYLFLVMK